MTRAIDLVVIGGSAGAIDVLRQVLPRLSSGFRPSVAIVIHLPANGPIVLHELFAGPESPPMRRARSVPS